LLHQQAPAGDLTVVLSSIERIRNLNREYAGDDRATDVLSFLDGSPEPESGRRYFGDVIVAVPIAEEQARQGGHTLSAEMALLVVHGVLHLLGHDHARARERARMEVAQREILEALGVASRPLEVQ
jgi:probable rRNA maturation factor